MIVELSKEDLVEILLTKKEAKTLIERLTAVSEEEHKTAGGVADDDELHYFGEELMNLLKIVLGEKLDDSVECLYRR